MLVSLGRNLLRERPLAKSWSGLGQQCQNPRGGKIPSVNLAQFIAWDRFAKKGVNIALGRSATFTFNSYSDYLADVDLLWNGKLGRQIREFVQSHASNQAENLPGFVRRVLDVYLMMLGGRKL